LDLNLTPIEYIQKKFPGKFKDMQDWRTAVGRFGVTGSQQMEPMRKMSDGQKRRVVEFLKSHVAATCLYV